MPQMTTTRTRSRFTRACWLLAPLPALLMLAINLSWFGRDPGLVHTGMLQGDQPTYTAMARAVFEQGNGLVYSNPFDDDPASPRVLCNLGYVLLGWLLRAVGDRAVLAWEIWRVVFGTLCFGLWGTLVARLIRLDAKRWPVFLLGALGGGVAWFAAFFQSPAEGLSGYYGQFVTAEGSYGWWALNLFRQALYPLELYYHTLLLAALIAWHARRRSWLPVLLALTWWSHVITAIKLTTILCTLLGAEWIAARRRNRERQRVLLTMVALVAVAALFGAYYQYYLPQFPAIAAWGEQTLDFVPILSASDGLRAYLPLLILAGAALIASGTRAARLVAHRRGAWLALAWVGATFALMHNHLYLQRPIQPLHFGRGHLYLGAVLLIGMLLQQALLRPRTPWRRTALGLCTAVALLAPIDNVLFAWRVAHERPQINLLTLHSATAEVLDWFRAHPPATLPAPIIHTFDQRLGVLLVAHTPYRVYASEGVLTPFFTERMGLVTTRVRLGDRAGLLQQGLSLLILDNLTVRGYPAWCHDPAQLRPLFLNRRYLVGEVQPQ